MLGIVLNWEDSSLTLHQEPDGRPRDPVGVAGHALVPPAVTGGDVPDLQRQVGQLGDSACRGRQDSPIPDPRQVVGGLAQDPAGQNGGLSRGHGHVGDRDHLRRGVCRNRSTGGTEGLTQGGGHPAGPGGVQTPEPTAFLRTHQPAEQFTSICSPCPDGATPRPSHTRRGGCVHACVRVCAHACVCACARTPTFHTNTQLRYLARATPLFTPFEPIIPPWGIKPRKSPSRGKE